MTVILIMQVQEDAASSWAAVDNSESSETRSQRTVLPAQAFAAPTQEEMGGERFLDSLCREGVLPGEDPHESWIRRGQFSSEHVIERIQKLKEFSHSELALLIKS